MTQYLSPLFGEYITDTSIARASGQQPGIAAQPTITSTKTASSPAIYQVTLSPNSSLGFWAWRPKWKRSIGSFLIQETDARSLGSITEPTTAGYTSHHLLVGWWAWAAGALNGDGSPTGEYGSDMQAVYTIVSGSAAAAPVDPDVDTADSSGRTPIILARLVLTNGQSPAIEWIPETMHDLKALGTTIGGHTDELETHTEQIAVALAAVVPTGGMVPFGGAAAPGGWLMADGSAVSRTTYSALYAVIGSTYGDGNGSTTFNLPNLAGRFPLGAGTAHALAATGGEETHTLSIEEIPAHAHKPLYIAGSNIDNGDPGALILTAGGDANGIQTSTDSYAASAGGGQAHNTMPPYLALSWIIKT